jgi:hypothetical protein
MTPIQQAIRQFVASNPGTSCEELAVLRPLRARLQGLHPDADRYVHQLYTGDHGDAWQEAPEPGFTPDQWEEAAVHETLEGLADLIENEP